MDEKPFETMNVIPFVDIMLVLLTIVLTTSSFIATGKIPINLPQASASPQDHEPPTTIEVTAQDRLFLNGQPTTLTDLRGELDRVDRQSQMLIRADRDITLQRFIDVADLLKQLSFAKVAVQTKAGN